LVRRSCRTKACENWSFVQTLIKIIIDIVLISDATPSHPITEYNVVLCLYAILILTSKYEGADHSGRAV
jgi:hypothetical protein